ncbi:MAG: toxin-antitoxin system, antitoxin component, Xre family protein [Clostridia bacterium]|nr:toxin-antitoxin system, antitoxin component, Xre family protein [Clostridia bacterium]
MTKTDKLQGKMREKGYTIKSLSAQMGLSPTGLFNKIHNKKEFFISEVQVIGDVLKLSNDELQDIFFAN